MNKITEKLLEVITDWKGAFNGAFNIREDGECVSRQSSPNVSIEPMAGGIGTEIHVSSKAQGETVYIPACVTKSDVNDLVYNDFYIGDGADVIIVAGCGVHNDGEGEARHNGIHRFFVGKGAHVVYKEKHVGMGEGTGAKRIDPVTDITLEEDAVLEMDTTQISGVDSTVRTTNANLKARAKLIITERLLTDGQETAKTDFVVNMNGEDSAVDLISRSVAKGTSRQIFHPKAIGTAKCSAHVQCDSIIMENARVCSIPEIDAAHLDAAIIHEAAIGRINDEQLVKLRTLGLTEEEAEAIIIENFLN